MKKETEEYIKKHPWTVKSGAVGGMEFNEDIYLKTMREWEKEQKSLYALPWWYLGILILIMGFMYLVSGMMF